MQAYYVLFYCPLFPYCDAITENIGSFYFTYFLAYLALACCSLLFLFCMRLRI